VKLTKSSFQAPIQITLSKILPCIIPFKLSTNKPSRKIK